jgi:steroid delta-isomerase-like uncharacterized protein
VEAFFDAYRAQDVDAMVRACSDSADFHYVPFEVSGTQRKLHGDGKVRSIGKELWRGLIACFPDLTNQVMSIHGDDAGNVAVEVTIGGTQAKVWGTVDPRGRKFSVPHLFLFRVNDAGLIDMISAYWDSAEMYQQLNRLALD